MRENTNITPPQKKNDKIRPIRTLQILDSFLIGYFSSTGTQLALGSFISNERYNIILAMHFRLIYFLTYKWLGSGMTISSTSTCDELGFYHILKVGYGLLF